MSQQAIARARRLEQQARERQREGKFAEAEEPLLLAMSIWKLVAGPDNIEIINDEVALAASYRRRGDVQLAIAKLDHATEVASKKFSEDGEWAHVYRLALNNTGIALREANDLEKARACLELALSLVEIAIEPPEDLMVERARVLDNLVSVLSLIGEHAQAERNVRESIALWTEVRGADALDTLVAMSNLAAVQMRTGELDGARATLLECESKLEAVLGPRHPDLADHWLLRAELAFRAHDGDGLASALHRCIDIAHAAGLPDHHPTVERARQMMDAAASSSPS